MSYQVLARKYRPKSFETLVGQEHVVRALSHALDQQRLHHAYLFTGTRGVGKTTLSRILAKSFNCQGADGQGGITSHPCGVCEACVAIDAGRFVDYIEMDAASNRGVDEMAQLLEQAVYAPSNARFKVYMIDEVHMLTNHAFNSMLKTLEEPPEHVKFILATTDPQKIPVTVLSRCLQFNLKQMPPGHIVGHLENILAQEQIAFDVPALRLLAQGAHGSMRDALSLTDQAIAYAAGKVSLDAVQGMLGALDQSYLLRMLDALAAKDGKALLDVADEMAARSLSYKTALQDLGTLLHQVAIAQMVPSAVADELPEREDVLRLAKQFGKEEVQLFYQIAVHGRNELALAPDEYAGFTMTLLRMLAFRPQSGDELSVAGSMPSPVRPAAPIAPAGASPARAPMRPAPTAGPSAATNVAASAAVATTAVATTTVTPPVNAATSVQAGPASPVATAPAVSVASPTIAASTTSETVAASAPPAATVAESAPARAANNPAMAALAAARAASGKAPTGNAGSAAAKAPVLAPSPAPAQAVATPVAQTSTASAAPVLAPALQAAPTPIVQVNKPAAKAPVDPMDDMPPPWDDDMLNASSASASFEEINAAGAWQDDEPVAVRPANPALVTKPVESATTAAHAVEPDVVALAEPQPALADAVSLMAPPPVAVVTDRPMSFTAIPELGWDGHWPNLAASLPVRGVAQQLAQQSELVRCEMSGNAAIFHLRVPFPTLLSAGSAEKLLAALSERFAQSGKTVRVETTIGAVEQTANAQAVAERAARQLQAEKSIQNDSFVQTLMREFGATIVTGSIKPV